MCTPKGLSKVRVKSCMIVSLGQTTYIRSAWLDSRRGEKKAQGRGSRNPCWTCLWSCFGEAAGSMLLCVGDSSYSRLLASYRWAATDGDGRALIYERAAPIHLLLLAPYSIYMKASHPISFSYLTMVSNSILKEWETLILFLNVGGEASRFERPSKLGTK